MYKTKFNRVINKKSLDCLTANLIRYVYYNCSGMYVSGSRKGYDSIIVNGKIVDAGISTRTTKGMLDVLEDSGRIVRYRGHNIKGKVKLGYMVLSDDFIEEIKRMIDFSKVKLKEKGSAVVLRGDNKELLEYGDSDFIRSCIRGVNKYNKLMSKVEVTLHNKITGELFIYPCQAVRIFSRGDFECNGRYYLTGGSVQTLSGYLRGNLEIDGEETQEADFKGLHLAIAGELNGYYWMEGFDPYNIYTSSVSIDPVKVKDHQLRYNTSYNPMRNFLKVCILVMINSKNKKQAIEALKSKLKSDSELEDKGNMSFVGIKCVSYDELFFDIEEHHQEIVDVFFSDSGIKFMRMDSDIIGYILDKCVSNMVYAIPVHDSIICKKKDLNKVIQYMKEGYKHVMGSDNNCVIEVK